MKVLTRTQIREADRYTIDVEGVPSIELMERAAMAFVAAFMRRFPSDRPVTVFAGPGNNGGDGLAIARLLTERRYFVRVFFIAAERYSPDFEANMARLRRTLPPHRIVPLQRVEDVDQMAAWPREVRVDALFGTGLTRPLKGLPAKIVDFLNATPGPIVAVDIPSGMYCDVPNAPHDPVVRAELAVSFQVPKPAFFMDENAEAVPHFEVVDIGLSAEFMRRVATPYYYLTPEEAAVLRPPVPRAAHKGMMGHLLLVAGSRGMMGAAVLAARAALRGGVGKLTAVVPGIGYGIMQQAVPEALCRADAEPDYISEVPPLEGFSAAAIGPGLGDRSDDVVGRIVEGGIPAVFDADALNAMARRPELMKRLGRHHVLTPHLGEFRRLVGEEVRTSPERWERLRRLAADTTAAVVLKGRYSAVASPDGTVTFNATGNAGLATGGSGDVLTGIVGALLARGMQPVAAAQLGVYLHGDAADAAVESGAPESLTPSDVIAAMPKAWRRLRL